MWPLSLRQTRQGCKIPANKRLFLPVRPTLDLALSGNRILNPIEKIGVNECRRKPQRRIAAESPGVVLCNACFKISARRTDIIRSICALKNVKPSAHRPSFETLGRFASSLLRMRLAQVSTLQMVNKQNPHGEEQREALRLEPWAKNSQDENLLFFIFDRFRCSSSRGMISTKLQGL
jgi:hypothetical protein